MAEEQPAGDLAVGGHDRDGQVAADRQVTLGHAVVGVVVAVARVDEDVVEADDPLAAERRGEDLGVARHREAFEGAALDAGERVEHVGLAGVGGDVVEEGAELGGGEGARGVGGELDDLLQLEPSGDRAAHALQRLGALLLAQQSPSRLLGLEAGEVLAVEQLQRLDRVRGHLGELDQDRLVVGGERSRLVPELDHAEARPVTRDQRRDQARAVRRAVRAAPRRAVARTDHVARRLGDDRQHVLVRRRRGHGARGVGQRAERVTHCAGSY